VSSSLILPNETFFSHRLRDGALRIVESDELRAWDTMVAAVATLEQPLPLKQISFAVAGSMPKSDQGRKVG